MIDAGDTGDLSTKFIENLSALHDDLGISLKVRSCRTHIIGTEQFSFLRSSMVQSSYIGDMHLPWNSKSLWGSV